MSIFFNRKAASEVETLIAEVSQVVDARAQAQVFEPVDVAIVCESTYPYLRGGLSAVVHQICEAHPQLKIGIIHITWDSAAPSEPLYDLPEHVAWVMPVYQSMGEHPEFARFAPGDSGLSGRDQRAVVARFFDAVDAHLKGDDGPLWSLFDDGINPLTRRFRLWPLLRTRWFMEAASVHFGRTGLTFAALLWKLRELASLAYATTDAVFPVADVYHAHTTGAAAILAAAAARQNGGRFFLTEHNLYTRDTINHALGRSMAERVRAEDCSADVVYRHVRTGALTTPTADMRAWMWWWVSTGRVAYRAAERISYLYPDAIDEAEALGGIPQKSFVIPNGVTPGHFDLARLSVSKRTEVRRRIWRFGYAARVVPIKGLLDLIDALVIVDREGFTDWRLDVMGPDGESPEYVELCRTRVAEAGLVSRVSFLGSVDLRARFGDYDALLLPSHNEGQPIVVLEAMTIGLPTVGTRVGGMRELVEDVLVAHDGTRLDPCGLLVEPHDVEGMARQILRLVTTPGLAEDLGRAGRERVERRFHVDVAMGMYRDVYRGTAAADTAGTEPASVS